MKKILIIFLIIFMIQGCADELDITPDGRTTLEDVFDDHYQTGAYLNSGYNYIYNHGLHYFFWAFLAGFSDEAHDNDAPTENLSQVQWYNGALTPTTNPLDMPGWNNNYYNGSWQGIRTANVFLANIGEANVNNEADRAQWTAEAKVQRAYYYWELIKKYGGMPIITEALDINTDFKSMERASFDDCVQFIVKDCQEAIAEPAFPWRIVNNEDNRGRFTKAVAYALMSQATLFNASPLWNPSNDAAKWQQAAQVSKEAMESLTANGYGLVSNYAEYFISTPDLSSSPADTETILELKNSPGTGQVHFLNGIPGVAAFKAGSTPSQELVDAYEMQNGMAPILGYNDEKHLSPIINAASGYDEQNPYENRDPRFYATVLYNQAYYGDVQGAPLYIESFVGGSAGIRNDDRRFTHNGYYLGKFVNRELFGGAGGAGKWKQYRLAEIYLNYAEAENEANGPTQAAYDAVNTVRARPSVNMPPLSGLSKEQLRERIRNERRVELSFEENRFWDVRRWKILNETDRLTTGMQWTKTGEGAFTGKRIIVDERQSYSDRFLIWPIPSNEISNTGFDQNPGW